MSIFGKHVHTAETGPGIRRNGITSMYLWKPDHDPTLDKCYCSTCCFSRRFVRVAVIRKGMYMVVQVDRMKVGDTLRACNNQPATIH